MNTGFEKNLRELAAYITEQARVADANCKEWQSGDKGWMLPPGVNLQSAYRAGMWYAYNDIRNRLPVCANPPTRTAPLEIEESVIMQIRQRRDAGRNKYGTSMERSDLSRLQWLQHAQEEALDFAIYLEKLKLGETLCS